MTMTAPEPSAGRVALAKRVLPYALLSPAVLVTLAIVFFPMIQAAWMSLHDYVLWKPHAITFVGLKNFITAFQDEVFWISLKHTVIWIGITIPAQMLLGLATAMLLNQEFPWRPLRARSSSSRGRCRALSSA
nr:hypothetical protein [Marinicella sp. W31]MDC2877262.1 hypothetical protein [Marinicella sp. W31]